MLSAFRSSTVTAARAASTTTKNQTLCAVMNVLTSRAYSAESKCRQDRAEFAFKREEEGKLLRVVMSSESGHNVFTTSNLSALNTRLTREYEDPTLRMVVLESKNDDIFSMGLCPIHLQEIGVDERLQLVHTLMSAVRRVHLAPVPTLAHVTGKAFAAGAVLATACDVRLLSTDAIMSFSESKVGLNLPSPAGEMLRQIVSPTAIFEIGVLGRKVDADTAAKTALATEIVDDLDVANAYIHDRLGKVSRLSRRVVECTLNDSKHGMKQLLDNFLRDVGNPKSIGAEHYKEFLTDDFIGEGITAYLEKRDPVWKR